MKLVCWGYAKCVKKILSSYQNVSVNYKSKSEGQLSALIEAFLPPCDNQIIELLLSHPDINPNIQTEFDDTPLHIGCRSDRNINQVKLLLQHSAIDVNIQNNKGDTPLHVSLCEPANNVTNLLLNVEDIDVNIQNNTGNTPIMCGFLFNYGWMSSIDFEIIQGICFNNKYDNNIRNNKGESFTNILLKYGKF